MKKHDRLTDRSRQQVSWRLAIGMVLSMAFATHGWADEYTNKACTAKIKAKNTSPHKDITIDKLSTAKGWAYVYAAQAPSKPHRVLENDGAAAVWTVELDTSWIDESGYGCDAIHRVKVDLLRGNTRCEDIKFPYSNGEPSNPSGSFVNKSKGGSTFDLGDLQEAFNACMKDDKCHCD